VYEALLPYGWSDRWLALLHSLERDDVAPGRVLRHDGMLVNVVGPDGAVAPYAVHTNVEPQPVVGDWVATTDAVVAVLPRSGLLRRQDPDGGEQPLVANVDAVVIVCGLDRPVKPGRVQRAVVLAWDAGAQPLVVLTKADLADAGEADRLAAELQAIDLGADVVVTSAATGAGIGDLRARCAGRTIVLFGESGAGKSTLTNALIGDDVAAIGRVRTGDSKGRHTTTSREVFLLPGGGVLVDTPGIRGVGLWIDEEAAAAIFDDVEEIAERCRFPDCQHEGQPGCAIEAALASGELSAARLDAWRLVLREQAAMARKSDPRARHAYGKQFAKLTKEASKRARRT
jgi:ribosome biogenesis GTPase